MAALTQDRSTPFKVLGRVASVAVAASETIYKGAMVSVNATGYLVSATDAAGETCIGVADEAGDNSAGSNGDIEIRVRRGCVAGFTTLGTVVDQADMGLAVYVSDDNNLEKIAGVTNNLVAGTLESIDGSTFYVKMYDQA